MCIEILTFDPSGNFKEGKGTTGIAHSVIHKVEDVNKSLSASTVLAQLRAEECSSDTEYWLKHLHEIDIMKPDYVVIEGYRLYNHRGKEASMQANSELETPQLIGAIKTHCYKLGITVVIQYASEVKSRWSDDVLKAKGIIDEKLRFNGERTNAHKRDALRHLLHFRRYKIGELL